MITIKAIFENGKSLITDINTDLAGATDYYLETIFNLGREDDELQRCVAVELVD